MKKDDLKAWVDFLSKMNPDIPKDEINSFIKYYTEKNSYLDGKIKEALGKKHIISVPTNPEVYFHNLEIENARLEGEVIGAMKVVKAVLDSLEGVLKDE